MRLTIRVIPRSSKNTLEWEEKILKARLTAPPIDGAANEALLSLLAERLCLPRRAIQIVRGTTSRQKTIEISDLTQEEFEQRLRNAQR